MLSELENTQLTLVGRGTPMGELQRRYWHPIGAVEELKDAWTKRVRLLGEDLVLFRDRSGALGLVAEFCPHRRASLAYGIPQQNGIRCPYHGWQFDGTGACIDQPNESDGSTFKEKISTAGYPVQALGGMIFAYLGPLPAPLLPRWPGFVVDGAIRQIGQAEIPCNWLQIMENSLDPVHTEWLHGKLQEFVEEKSGFRRHALSDLGANIRSRSRSKNSSTACTNGVCSKVRRRIPTTGGSATRCSSRTSSRWAAAAARCGPSTLYQMRVPDRRDTTFDALLVPGVRTCRCRCRRAATVARPRPLYDFPYRDEKKASSGSTSSTHKT